MYYISETSVCDLVRQEHITPVIESVFVSLAADKAFNFPVVRDRLDYRDAIFGFKSGFDRSGPILGVKAGGLWPSNRSKGLPNHQSTIVLFDAETGGPHALVRGTYLTALRTAAISALSIRYLARDESQILGLIGAGGQAQYQIAAALKEREFSNVLVSDMDFSASQSLVDELRSQGIEAKVATAEATAIESDVIITVTPSFKPYVMSDWISPGTHICCMGADTKGKHEIETSLMSRANLFADVVDQSATIGEFQHAVGAGVIQPSQIQPIGNVFSGAAPGRVSADDITVFDSTGMGLQDLAAAQAALDIVRQHGRAIILED